MNYYQVFIFITDVSNTLMNADINSSNIVASCNGSTMGIGNGYFKSPVCAFNIIITNTFNNVILYKSANVAS